jgi:hypothetical protein
MIPLTEQYLTSLIRIDIHSLLLHTYTDIYIIILQTNSLFIK